MDDVDKRFEQFTQIQNLIENRMQAHITPLLDLLEKIAASVGTVLASVQGPAPTDMENRINQFIKIRDYLDKKKEEQAKELKPAQGLKDQLSGILQVFLASHKSESLNTKAGTVYRTTRYSASLVDPDAFMRHVIGTEQYELLDRRANVTAVREFVEKNGGLPPGAKLSAIETVGVRRRPGT